MSLAMAITLIVVLGLSALIYLAVRSGERYGHQDAHVHSTEYAGVIREGHGPLTVFLIASFALILLWTGIYLFSHRGEFTSSQQGASSVSRGAEDNSRN